MCIYYTYTKKIFLFMQKETCMGIFVMVWL